VTDDTVTPEAPQTIVRVFEGRRWVPLEEAGRLNDALQEASVTIAGLRNALRTATSSPEPGPPDPGLLAAAMRAVLADADADDSGYLMEAVEIRAEYARLGSEENAPA
jgi:hypothetical protein